MDMFLALVGAFAGGVFGALFGGTTLFIFMGLMVLLGAIHFYCRSHSGHPLRLISPL
jgi:hypothetical protein